MQVFLVVLLILFAVGLVYYGLAKTMLIVVLIGAGLFVGSAAVAGFARSVRADRAKNKEAREEAELKELRKIGL